MMWIISALLSALFSFSCVVSAGDCIKTASVCVDATPCRSFSGATVCLSQLGLSCWEYEDTYTCIKPNAVNYCQPLIDAQPACWQSGSQCAATDTIFNTGCMRHTQTWRCSDPSRPTPANTTRLADTYTLVSSGYDPAPCQSLADNPSCTVAESQCVSTTPDSPLPAGVDPAEVAPDGCYQKRDTYVCTASQVDPSDCAQYASNSGCSLVSSECDPDDPQCNFETKTYRCQTTPENTSTLTTCGDQAYCVSGNCFAAPAVADTDMAAAVATMEAQREAGVYLDGNLQIFSGVSSQCSIKLFGLGNCCKKNTTGGQSNNLMAQFAVTNIANNAGGYLLNKTSNAIGSTYVYDSLFQSDSPDWIVKGFSSMFGDGGGFAGGWAPSLNFMGLGVTFGGIAPAGTTALASLSTESVTVYWNPTAFYWTVALMLLQEILSCDQDEQILAMKRGSNLCVRVGSYCSSKFLKICIEKKDSYCCFNSKLARIINEQGRSQIGRGWGSAESPDCSGFTANEMQGLDLSKMDLSEFYAEIAPSLPDAAGVRARAAAYDIDPLKSKPSYYTSP